MGFPDFSVKGPAFARRARVKRILVCLDHSARETFVFVQAKELAEKLSARLTLLHVVVPKSGLTLPGVPDSPETKARLDDALRELNELGSQVAKDHLERCVAEAGEPWRVITHAARTYAADYVLIGTHGFDRTDVLFGSTVRQVVEHADRTVIVARPKPRE